MNNRFRSPTGKVHLMALGDDGSMSLKCDSTVSFLRATREKVTCKHCLRVIAREAMEAKEAKAAAKDFDGRWAADRAQRSRSGVDYEVPGSDIQRWKSQRMRQPQKYPGSGGATLRP